MDYLLRDSYCTGVQYGLFDQEWILNALCVGVDPDASDPESSESLRLCLDAARGKEAAEQFILARAHMNEQVYFHRVTRGYEVLLLRLFQVAADAEKKGTLPAGTPESVKAFLCGLRPPIEFWTSFDEAEMLAAFHVWSRCNGSDGLRELKRFSDAFLNRERILDCVVSGGLGPADMARLFGLLHAAGLAQDRDWFLDDIEASIYKGVLYAAGKAGDPEERRIESILVASGEPTERAWPIEATDKLLQHLEQEKRSIQRIYFERSRASEFHPVFQKVRLVPYSEGGRQ